MTAVRHPHDPRRTVDFEADKPSGGLGDFPDVYGHPHQEILTVRPLVIAERKLHLKSSSDTSARGRERREERVALRALFVTLVRAECAPNDLMMLREHLSVSRGTEASNESGGTLDIREEEGERLDLGRVQKATWPGDWRLFHRVTHGLDVVAVRVAHKRAVVVGVILGPDTRLVEDVCSNRNRSVEEGAHSSATSRREGNVRLAESIAGSAGRDPEVGVRRYPESNGVVELHHTYAADRRQDRAVEGGARVDVRTLNGEVVDHPDILTHASLRLWRGELALT